jgi:prepilin-type N-terminal cleavage/methylation domain-containing protein
MRIQNSPRTAFTLVEIMIVVAIIGLLAAIAIPNFVRARENAQRTACILNLEAINGAKAMWALETKRGNSDTPTDNDMFGPGLYISKKPLYPTNGTYSLNQVDAKPACSVATPPCDSVLHDFAATRPNHKV